MRQLRLFLDDMKLIRCGGRIHNAPTTDASKFPYLLPNKHVVTRMIVADTHKKLHHGGVSITVTALRQVYWIPCIRQCVKSVLRRCVPCRKLIGKPYRSPDPPPLPKVHVMEYTNTVRLANYLNACIHQLQINQLIATQLNGGVKRSNLQLS